MKRRIVWERNTPEIITKRVISERVRPRADVLWGLPIGRLLQLQRRNLLFPYTPAGGVALRTGFRSDRSPMTWTGTAASASALCFNTIIGTQTFQLPAIVRWQDLLGQYYRAQAAIDDPNTSETAFLTVAGWIAAMGDSPTWEFVRRLRANGLQVLPAGEDACTNAARGKVAVGIGVGVPATMLASQGAPIQIIVPTPVAYDLDGTAIVRGAAHLAAARALADFSTSRAAMDIYATRRVILALPASAAAMPSVPAETEQRLAATEIAAIAAHREAILRHWNEVFSGTTARAR